MKRLQRYYYLVGGPVALLVLGTIAFFDAILSTVRGNPHPQINYIIFALMVAGCALMMMHVARINREGKLLQGFLDELHNREGDANAVREWLKNQTSRRASDVKDVLELVLDSQGMAVGPVQHAAIESEIHHLDSQLQRRLLLAQSLSGLMVGMGLLGTFIGLLGALSEIGKLIGSFAMGPGMSDPVAAVSELVTRLTEPMKAMGVAFSASLFGVLGSLVVGLLLVFVRSATGELLSLVQSRVSWLIDIGTSGEASGDAPVRDALAELAEHSPLLKGLAVALDQSERRVRTMLTAFEELTVQLRTVSTGHAELLAELKGQADTRDQHLAEARATHETLKQVVVSQQRLEEKAAVNEPVAQQIRDLIEFTQARHDALHAATVASIEAANANVAQDREALMAQFEGITQLQRQAHENLLRIATRIEQVQSGQSSEWRNFAETTARNQSELRVSQDEVARAILDVAADLRSDGQQRQLINEKLRLSIDEQLSRQEQLVHALLRDRD